MDGVGRNGWGGVEWMGWGGAAWGGGGAAWGGAGTGWAEVAPSHLVESGRRDIEEEDSGERGEHHAAPKEEAREGNDLKHLARQRAHGRTLQLMRVSHYAQYSFLLCLQCVYHTTNAPRACAPQPPLHAPPHHSSHRPISEGGGRR